MSRCAPSENPPGSRSLCGHILGAGRRPGLDSDGARPLTAGRPSPSVPAALGSLHSVPFTPAGRRGVETAELQGRHEARAPSPGRGRCISLGDRLPGIAAATGRLAGDCCYGSNRTAIRIACRPQRQRSSEWRPPSAPTERRSQRRRAPNRRRWRRQARRRRSPSPDSDASGRPNPDPSCAFERGELDCSAPFRFIRAAPEFPAACPSPMHLPAACPSLMPLPAARLGPSQGSLLWSIPAPGPACA